VLVHGLTIQRLVGVWHSLLMGSEEVRTLLASTRILAKGHMYNQALLGFWHLLDRGGSEDGFEETADTAKQCHLVTTSPHGGGTPLGVLRNSARVSAWVDNSKACWSAA
jgi:hypothetical protein